MVSTDTARSEHTTPTDTMSQCTPTESLGKGAAAESPAIKHSVRVCEM